MLKPKYFSKNFSIFSIIVCFLAVLFPPPNNLIGGSILSISQFTLYADTLKGRRPSYIDALRGEEATKLYDIFNEKLRNYVSVSTGIFGSDMKVSITNDGPVTIIMER